MRFAEGSGYVCTYTVAVSRSISKQKIDDNPDIQTADFIRCVCFGNNASFVSSYFSKGSPIAVSGRLQISSYTDSEGNRKWSTEVITTDHCIIGNKHVKEVDTQNEAS